MGCEGDPVHGELITDGDASTATVLVLYKSGTTTVRTLAADEFLSITDVLIVSEDGGDISLLAGSAGAAGKYIVHGNFAANGGVDKSFSTPYTCPIGVTPYFKGAAANLDVCVIEGFITKI